MSREKASDIGCLYWEDYIQGQRGNHWSEFPSLALMKGKVLSRMKNGISVEVLYDDAYCRAWFKNYNSVLDCAKLISKPDFEAFEAENIPNASPRWSVYTKFKEWSLKCREK